MFDYWFVMFVVLCVLSFLLCLMLCVVSLFPVVYFSIFLLCDCCFWIFDSYLLEISSCMLYFVVSYCMRYVISLLVCSMFGNCVCFISGFWFFYCCYSLMFVTRVMFYVVCYAPSFRCLFFYAFIMWLCLFPLFGFFCSIKFYVCYRVLLFYLLCYVMFPMFYVSICLSCDCVYFWLLLWFTVLC